MTTIKHVHMFDSMTRRRSPAVIHDDMLSAVRLGKSADLGRQWVGELRSRIDRIAAAVSRLETPFTVGNTLHAEALAKCVDLGRVFDGLTEMENLLTSQPIRESKGNEPPSDSRNEGDGAHRVGGAKDGLYDRSRRPAALNQGHSITTPSQINSMNRAAHGQGPTTRDGPKPSDHPRDHVRGINDLNREFWQGR